MKYILIILICLWCNVSWGDTKRDELNEIYSTIHSNFMFLSDILLNHAKILDKQQEKIDESRKLIEKIIRVMELGKPMPVILHEYLHFNSEQFETHYSTDTCYKFPMQ